MTLFSRILLFITAYSPLLTVWAVRTYSESPFVTYGLTIMIVFSGIGGAYVWYLKRYAESATKQTFAKASSRSSDVVGYILPYLISFYDLNLDDLWVQVGLVAFFGVLGILYVNLNLVYINPLLNLFGYHLFEVELPDGTEGILLSRDRVIPADQTISVSVIDDYIYLAV